MSAKAKTNLLEVESATLSDDPSLEPSQYSVDFNDADDEDDDEIKVVKTPLPSQKNIPMIAAAKISQLAESLLPASVFRKHLELAKNSEKVITQLGEEITLATDLTTGIALCEVSPITENGSTANCLSPECKYEPFETKAAELLRIHSANTITFENVIAHPMHHHTGKVLKCVNAALPVLSKVNNIYRLSTVVENVETTRVCRVEVVCDLHQADLLSLALKCPYLHGLMPGSTFLIHDPIFKTDSSERTLSLCVEKFNDIAFLGHVVPNLIKMNCKDSMGNSEESDSTIFSEWTESDEGDEDKSKASLWAASSTCEEMYAKNEWREWGNEYSVQRMHSQAYIAYSIALRFDPSSVELSSARGASLINLGMFSAALKDVEAVYNEDPFNTGLILRKTHCLWGQNKYDEALIFLKNCFEKLLTMQTINPEDDTIRKCMFVQNIISKTEKMMRLKEDPQLLDNETFFKNQAQVSHTEPEFYAPFKVTTQIMDGDTDNFKKTTVVDGTIAAGTLLAKTKAFTVVFQIDGLETEKGSRNDELLNLTIQKMLIEKPTEAELYNCIESTISSDRQVDLSKTAIIEFCEKYSYASYHHTAEISMGVESNECSGLCTSQTIVHGVWTFPANIRHACVGGNAIWYICGNFMFIRAISNIKAGEEVVMAHVDPTKPYEFRKRFLKKKGIKCACTLCQFEKNESESTKAKRNELMKFAHLNQDTSFFEVRKLRLRLDDLESLRSAFAKLNFPIVEPLYNFGVYLMKSQNFDDAIAAFEKAFFVVDNTAAIFTLVNLSFLLSYCYMAKKKGNDKSRSKKWFNAMKSYAKLSYGSLTPVKYKFKTEFDYLKRKGIAV